MVQRVVLHVGCPKTGTTALQQQLFMNPIALASQGLMYPRSRVDQHFLATIDVLDLPWEQGVKNVAVGAWAALVDEVRASELTAIVSHELLGRATSEQAAQVVASLGDVDVSVVITARDLGRQIPAEYQEHLKHRSVMTYRTFLDRLVDPDVDDFAGGHARHTWWVQDVPSIAERWGSAVGADKVTIVTVPPKGAPRDLLMQRFGMAAGFDATRFREIEELSENRSLGIAETELLRRVNERYNERLDDSAYAILVRNILVKRLVPTDDEATPLSLPLQEFGWVRERSEAWVETLREAGYPVVGDLEELLPEKPVAETAADVPVDDDQVLDAALQALVGGVAAYDELCREVGPPRESARARVLRRSKERIVREAGKSALGQRALRAWVERH
ncbi:MAG: hypothetical protein ACTHJM_13770 [Marmoricola sp.]